MNTRPSSNAFGPRKLNRVAALVSLAAVSVLWPVWTFAQSAGASNSEGKSHFHVEFGPLPSGWTSSREVMDSHWEALKTTGINYYALGAPVAGHTFAERSNPQSPLYQAWFGVYAVNGQGDVFKGNDRNAQFTWLARLAEYDQDSWLSAMGDPHPMAHWESHSSPRVQIISGAARTTFSAKMISHSDVSALGKQSTPLARSLGMPDIGAGPVRVAAFHPITLTGFYAFWYDASRDTTFVVYGVSSEFTDQQGHAHNNAPTLRKDFRKMLANVRIVEN